MHAELLHAARAMPVARPATFAVLASTLWLAACGGGDAEDTATRQQGAPSISAISVQPVDPWRDEPVTLSVRCRGAASYAYEWTIGKTGVPRAGGASVVNTFNWGDTFPIRVRCTDPYGQQAEQTHDLPVYWRNLSALTGVPCTRPKRARGWCRQLPAQQGTTLRQVHVQTNDVVWGVDGQGRLRRTANAGKSWPMPGAPGNGRYTALSVVGSTVAWAAGTAGLVARSTDDGQTWTTMPAPTEADLVDVRARSVNMAWALARNAVLRMTDGKTWRQVHVDSGEPWAALMAYNGQHAVVVGDAGRLLITTNGGTSWEPGPALATASLTAATVDRTNKVGWVVSAAGDVLLHDATTGSWTVKRRGPAAATGLREDWRAVHAPDAKTVWVAGARSNARGTVPVLLRSLDAGDTWQEIGLPGSNDPLVALGTLLNGHVYASGTRSMIEVPSSGGARFITELPPADDWQALSAPSQLYAWLVASNGTVQATVDGGKRWEDRSSGAPDHMRDVLGLDAQRGWLVAGDTRLFTWDEPGRLWLPRSLGTGLALQALVRSPGLPGTGSNPEAVWALGAAGAVLRSTDGLATWKTMANPGTTLDLVQGSALNGQSLWVVARPSGGASGAATLLHSVDGAASWQVVALPGAGEIDRVVTAGTAGVWVQGHDPANTATLVVWHSVDDGATWQRRVPRIKSLSYRLAAFDDKAAWLIGQREALRTTNGGASWFVASSSPTVGGAVSAIAITDNSSAWVAGDSGEVWKTMTNGGD